MPNAGARSRRQEDLDLVSFDSASLQAWAAAVAKIGLGAAQLQAVLSVRCAAHRN